MHARVPPHHCHQARDLGTHACPCMGIVNLYVPPHAGPQISTVMHGTRPHPRGHAWAARVVDPNSRYPPPGLLMNAHVLSDASNVHGHDTFPPRRLCGAAWLPNLRTQASGHPAAGGERGPNSEVGSRTGLCPHVAPVVVAAIPLPARTRHPLCSSFSSALSLRTCVYRPCTCARPWHGTACFPRPLVRRPKSSKWQMATLSPGTKPAFGASCRPPSKLHVAFVMCARKHAFGECACKRACSVSS